MYTKYVPLAGATAVQVLDDLCSIIIGSTPISGLSASCDKVNSAIIASSIASNWTMYDATASASARVLRSLNADGVSYKYLQISYVTTTISFTIYESWNATTHVGTNPGFYSSVITAGPQLVTVTTTGFWVLASARNLFVTQSASRSIWVGEFSRDSKAIDSTYPCHFMCGCTYGFTGAGASATVSVGDLNHAALCRIKYAQSAGDLKSGSTPATTGSAHGVTPFGSPSTYHLGYASNDTGGIRTPGSEQSIYVASALYVQSSFGVLSYAGVVGKIPEILCTVGIASNNLDEVTVDGVTCVVVTIANTGALLVPKG